VAQPRIAVGFSAAPKPPLAGLRQSLRLTRLLRLDSFMVWDHLQDIVPSALWDRRLSWMVGRSASPHECFDFQTILGDLAGRAGAVRLGVGVTEPIRRHPVVIAQAMVTLAHLTRRPPILGIGAGERENTEPYGLDFARPVDRLEEALRVIRLCFEARGPLDFAGEHFRLDQAIFDLKPPRGRTPEIWIGGGGPRLLRLTGQYGDGWYPVGFFTPAEYATKLAAIHAHARAAGRDPAAITPSLQAYLVVAPSEREARAMLDTKLIRFFGLLIPAEHWRKLGLTHPFGEGFRGYVDFLPERYTRPELEDAVAAVPAELADAGVIYGTPAQVIARLRAYSEAGLRHVVPQLMSAAVSRRAALYGLYALRVISRALASGG
jgi:phthiodiolone/phenolphthiodiolone dimycocerosates ketoreductase